MTEKLSNRVLSSIEFWRQSSREKLATPFQAYQWEARAKTLEEILPDVEALEAENEALKAKLEAIQQVIKSIQEALARLHRYANDDTVLQVEIPNERWLTHREEKWLNIELSLTDDPNGDALRVRHLQALVKAIGGNQ